MSSATIDTATKFHLSLNINQLDASIAFLTAMLGCPPKTRHADYAKFEPDDVPLVLSLAPRRVAADSSAGIAGLGGLNHLGFRVRDAAALVEIQRRLEAAGYATQREEGVECCHSRQSKFWVRDPDGNQWEVYLLEDDDEHGETACATKEVVNLPATTTAGPAMPTASDAPLAAVAVWTHRLDEDFVVELADNSLDEIQLQGTFNSRRFADMHLNILRRTLAALRPGGKLLVHTLATGRAPSAVPKLPGPAAVVTHVPVDEQLVSAAEAAGFTAIELLRFSDAPCFQCDGVAMRELQFVALKPDTRSDEGEAVVVYRGPLTQVVDEDGRVYRRGRRVPVDSATRDRLRHGSAQGSFAFPEDPPSSTPPAQG